MPDDLTAILDEWHMRTSLATAGPWSIDEKRGLDVADEYWSEVRIKDAEGADVAATFISHLLEPGNSAQDEMFIVKARTAMPRLLAAVRAVLELAEDWAAKRPTATREDHDFMETRQGCADELREAITRELTGKGDSSDA